jgi:RNA polymerase sigma factor (sigma-70 family)
VEGSISLKKNWVLTQDAFNILLSSLDPDHEIAGRKYENIRQGLITFFECRGSAAPEDHADETINRVARRLAEGKEIYSVNPASYFYGVARNVLKELWEVPVQASGTIEDLPPSKHLSDDPNHRHEQQLEREQRERRLESLERCLDGLASPERTLISEYYVGETDVKIQNRKSLAERLGVPLNALRIRALRIREKLESCVERHLRGADPVTR